MNLNKYIPKRFSIFYNKKFLIFSFLSFVVIFFIFISLNHIKSKIEKLIHQKVISHVANFEKQTGLKIKWKTLQFTLFTITLKLNDVQFVYHKPEYLKKKSFLDALDGMQKVSTILARPSLHSLIFKKQIILSKLQIRGGDIYVKTFKSTYKKYPDFPFKQIFIKKVNLNIKHNKNHILLSQTDLKIWQKTTGQFHFNFLSRDVTTNTNLDLSLLQLYKKNQLQKFYLKKDKKLNVFAKGLIKKDHIFFDDIILKNEYFQSKTDWLDIYLTPQGIKNLSIKSSGSLPSFIIHKSFDLIDLPKIPLDALMSYDFNIQYKKNQGYQGVFKVQAASTKFKSYDLDRFSIKGYIKNLLVTIEDAFVQTRSHGSIRIKASSYLLKQKVPQFRMFMDVKNLSSQFLVTSFLKTQFFPVQGDITGSIKCSNVGDIFDLKCNIQARSKALNIRFKKQTQLSFYNLVFKSDIEWNNKYFKFLVFNQQDSLPHIRAQGTYYLALNELQSDFSFSGLLSKDIKFYTNIQTEGKIHIQKARLHVKNNHIKMNGVLKSPFLKLQEYQLKNISSTFKWNDHKLQFVKLTGYPGKSNYFANADIDFLKKEIFLKFKFPFFDLEDIHYIIQNNVSLPVSLKGTGAAFAWIRFPWLSPHKKSFKLKGHLFHTFVNKDLFKYAAFDLEMKNNTGIVKKLSLQKSTGSIVGTGSFDQNLFFKINFLGHDLDLSRMQWIHSIFPFHASGIMNFKLHLRGTARTAKMTGNIFTENMFLYDYPVNNSQFKIIMDSQALHLSGHFMKELYIKKFTYPFNKTSSFEAQGHFKNWNFVNLFLSKHRINSNYFSKMTGNFSLIKNKKTQFLWKGYVNIKKFFVSKLNQWMTNSKPISVFLHKGIWSVNSFNIAHHNHKTLHIKQSQQDRLIVSGESFLSLFSFLFPFGENFRGHVNGQLSLNNNLKNPQIDGKLKISKAFMLFDLLPEFQNVTTDISFVKNNIFIKNFRGTAGSGSLQGQGQLIYDFTNPLKVDLNLIFKNTHLNIPQDFKTKGSGQLNITGSQAPYMISGQYFIDSGRIIKDFSQIDQSIEYDSSLLDQNIKQQKSLFNLNLNFKTNKSVVIDNDYIKSFVTGQARARGPLNALLLKGSFHLSRKLKDNFILFRDQEFKIKSGTIVFNHAAFDNPYLNIQSSLLFTENIQDSLNSNNQQTKNTYQIFLSLTGLKNKLKINLESEPSLKEKEIISLLAFGVNLKHFDKNVQQNVTEYSYQFLGSLFLESFLKKEIKQSLDLDFRLTPYINVANKPVTKITLSKNWLNQWKTSFSRTLEDSHSDIKLKYDFNQNMSVTAFWEDPEDLELQKNQKDRLGLDLEFRFDF